MRGGSGGREGELEAALRPLRIIAGALMFGPAAFVGVVLFLRSDPARTFVDHPTEGMVTWAALAFGTAVVVVSLLLPRPKRAGIERVRGDVIIRLALVESGSLLGSVAYLIEGEAVGLGVAVLCLAAMALLHFPTRDRVQRLVADAS